MLLRVRSRHTRGMDTTDSDTNNDPGLDAGADSASGTTKTEAPAQAFPPTSCEYDDRLHRAGDGRMLAGVAGGLGEYFDIDPTLVRVGFVVLTLVGGLAIPLYLAGWLLIPAQGADASVAEELLAHERAR
jgi:phage shock protein PspC (stress-responsive transcriptional regulator)